MRSAACFFYILSVIVYLQFMDDSRFAFGFNIVTQLLFTAIVCYYATNIKGLTRIDKLLFYYVATMSIGRGIYTSFCVYAKRAWILYNTDVFTFILCVSFGLFLIYLAKSKK